MAIYKLLIVLGISVIVIMGIFVGLSISKVSIASQEYDIFVDPFKDEQNLFTTARVIIQNTGSQPLTNVRVNFGGGDIEELGILKPGQKIIVSPPAENDLLFVMVTTDEGIFVNKAFRTPAKMPGMMGS